MRSFVSWHAERHTTARVVQYELEALGEEHRTEIVALRRRTRRGWCAGSSATASGRASSTSRDVPGTTLAVLSLCIDVARWFNAQGSRTPDEVGTLYADLVLRMVGATRGRTPRGAPEWRRRRPGPDPGRLGAARGRDEPHSAAQK